MQSAAKLFTHTPASWLTALSICRHTTTASQAAMTTKTRTQRLHLRASSPFYRHTHPPTKMSSLPSPPTHPDTTNPIASEALWQAYWKDEQAQLQLKIDASEQRVLEEVKSQEALLASQMAQAANIMYSAQPPIDRMTQPTASPKPETSFTKFTDLWKPDTHYFRNSHTLW